MQPSDIHSRHRREVLDQFSRQAIPFTRIPGHHDALQLLLQFSGVTAADQVLDVACGPGILACALARQAATVTGLDLTPAMLEQAALRQQQEGLSNLQWQSGDAQALPFADGQFSLCVTRYSFHHLLEPAAVLEEMCRVTRPGGRVLVADVAMPAACVAAYDAFEKVRDPSHVHALSEEEFAQLFRASGLLDCCWTEYTVDIALEAQLQASFPVAGGDAWLRQRMLDDVGPNLLGVQAYWQAGELRYRVPIRVYRGVRAGSITAVV